MQDLHAVTAFAGIDGRMNTALPEWFAAETDADITSPPSFAAAIRDLPRATATEIAYRNPYTEEWVATERFTAIVEPSRLVAQADDQPRADGGTETQMQSSADTAADTDALFHVPSNSYSIINPTDVYAPLEDVLRSTEFDGRTLGDVVFGEIRQYRDGGEVHMDLMFDGLAVDLPGRTDPITLGVSSGYDFFGGHAVYVEGFARDTACANSIRGVTDREVVKHVGDVDGFGQWWERILGQLDLVADDLLLCIDEAQTIDVDFTEMPFDVETFYDLLGFPDYLAEQAAADARATAADPFAIDLWTLHSGATYSLTHFFRGKEGSALQRYQRIANDILFNPEATVERVETAYEQRLEEQRDEDAGEGQQASIQGRAGWRRSSA